MIGNVCSGKQNVKPNKEISKRDYMSDGGKGSAPRPFSVSQEEYDNRWEHIFGRDRTPTEKQDAANEDEAFKHLEIEQKLKGIGTNH